MHKVQLSIPTAHRDVISKLAALSDDEAELLRATLESATPTDSPVKLAAAVASTLRTVPIDAVTVVSMLLAVRSVADSHFATMDEAAASVSRDAAAKNLIPKTSSTEAFRNRLERFLLLKSIAQTAKAFYLSTEYRDRVLGSRIITDIRPVFDDAGSSPMPAGSILMHTLRLETVDGKDLYVSMTTEDLVDLKRQVDRAIRKAEILDDLIKGGDLRRLDDSDESKTE